MEDKMKDLQTQTHRTVLLIAVAIALGITVHEGFLVLAQILAVVWCIYLMIAALNRRAERKARAH